MMDSTPEQYSCIVQEVFSGDDLIAFVDLGVENLWKRQRIRLHGVDTPNAMNCGESTPAGRLRKEIQTMVRNRRGLIQVVAKNAGSWVCYLTIESSTAAGGVIQVNQELIERGYVFKKRHA